jgi:hypothetical protein
MTDRERLWPSATSRLLRAGLNQEGKDAGQPFRWSAWVWSPPPESNRRPHPYHESRAHRCADQRFRTHGVGPCQGREGIGPLVRPGGWLACGGADRQGRRPGRGFGVGSHAPIRAPEGGVRMTVSPDPGCSVRSTAVLQAHAETRARPVLAFSDAGAVSSWVRMWKERASSRRAIAVVAMWLPRRRASWA